jgi:RNA polymerase sigma-70 factor (ECF subfamily)
MGDSPESDAELLTAWQAGDQLAGNRLVRRHFDGLFRFFRSRLDDGVPDLVQQTFLGAVESQARIPAETEFRAWLFGIARKKLLMHLRSSERRHRVIADDSSREELAPSLGDALGEREHRRLLLRALRHLPVDVQLLLELAYWESMSMEELAGVFEIASGTVKSRLHRARELLREEVVRLSPTSDTADVTFVDLERWARDLGGELRGEKS